MEIKKTFFLGIICTLWFSSCKKKDDDYNKPIVYNTCMDTSFVNERLKSKFFPQQGSYWVYAIDSSSTEDCTYVTASIFQKGSYMAMPKSPGQGPTCYPYKSAVVYFSGATEPTKYYLTGTEMIFNCPLGYECPYLCYINAGGHISSDSIQHYANLSIYPGTLYNDVYKIRLNVPSGVSNTAYNGSYFNIKDGSYFYINDSIGIVRKDLYQGNGLYKRYYLKRYHIVK